MKVRMNLGDSQVWLGNNGVIFQVWDNDGKYRGKFRIGKAKVEWCQGKKPIGNGKKKNLDTFISDTLTNM